MSETYAEGLPEVEEGLVVVTRSGGRTFSHSLATKDAESLWGLCGMEFWGSITEELIHPAIGGRPFL